MLRHRRRQYQPRSRRRVGCAGPVRGRCRTVGHHRRRPDRPGGRVRQRRLPGHPGADGRAGRGAAGGRAGTGGRADRAGRRGAGRARRRPAGDAAAGRRPDRRDRDDPGGGGAVAGSRRPAGRATRSRRLRRGLRLRHGGVGADHPRIPATRMAMSAAALPGGDRAGPGVHPRRWPGRHARPDRRVAGRHRPGDRAGTRRRWRHPGLRPRPGRDGRAGPARGGGVRVLLVFHLHPHRRPRRGCGSRSARRTRPATWSRPCSAPPPRHPWEESDEPHQP